MKSVLRLTILLPQVVILCAFSRTALIMCSQAHVGQVSDAQSELVDPLPWEYDMVEDERSILPWELDVLLPDINTQVLQGSISHLLGHPYLSSWPSNQTFVWPLRGIIHGRNSRLMVSAPTSLSPDNALANEIDPPTVVVHYLVDTSSPYTYLSEDAVKSLSSQPFYYDTYDTLPICIHGIPIQVHVSPPTSHFKEVSLLGADFMKAIQGEIHAFYGGKKTFTIVKGSSPSLMKC